MEDSARRGGLFELCDDGGGCTCEYHKNPGMAGEFYPRFLIQLLSSPSLAYTSVSLPTMRLTIIAPDSVHEHEVSPSLLIQDIINIVEATVSQL